MQVYLPSPYSPDLNPTEQILVVLLNEMLNVLISVIKKVCILELLNHAIVFIIVPVEDLYSILLIIHQSV